MQDDSAPDRTFFHRTNRLAARLGVQIDDLPRIIGLGRRTLFECRSADSAASDKSWAKLEIAERMSEEEAEVRKGFVETSGNPKDSPARKPPAANSIRMIPVIGWAHAGDAESYEEVPDSWKETIPTECHDVKAFAVSLEGDSMEPKFSDGDLLIVQPSEEAYSGCYVVARFKTDGVIFRRMECAGGEIVLKPLNDGWPMTRHRPEEFSWIYPVWGRWTQIWRRR